MALRDAGFDMRLDSEAFASIQYQNANNSVRVTDEFMERAERGEYWELKARVDDGRDRARRRQGRAQPARRRRLALRRSGRAVRHDHQRVAHLPELGPDQRVEPVLGVHARGRLGVQPGVAQPDEVPARGRHVRRRGVRARGRRRDPRAGDRGRAVELPDRGDRRQRARVPPARHGLREPRRAPDGERPRVRLRRGPRDLRRDHRADDRPRLPHLGRGGGSARAVRALRGEPRPAQPRDAQAPSRGVRDRRLAGGRHRAARRRAARVGRGRGDRRAQRLPQRPGHGARPHRDDLVPDGLRHHRHRARLLARQVQGAGGRRADDDREPDRAAGARDARLLGRGDRGDRGAPGRERRRSSARPACATSTSRCSTWPWASGRSRRWAT